ncbi:divergent polysaccharide deacetylase family protein [Aestuariivirga litoralis]|uniref:divergent polysaccharide deacetylase family protein n=1 Tax=Aestuariivirga litoralis TaxID=2650924 RepID=UPI0018C5FA24|nr:divergent polysaccharide deacetylase family protein [Aestuariivirga litoralis]MBG1233555.1 divergent polysaccharide deacetylase family protein [Aestuariivirga litoralis]
MRRDELKQPLHKRNTAARLWQQRPSALVSAYAIMLCVYAGSGVWLTRQHAPFAGEPVVTVAMAPIEVTENLDMAQSVVKQDKLATEEEDAVDVTTASTDIAPSSTRQKITKMDSHVTIITNSRPSLVKAPVEAVTETSDQGPLPKIASNGARPADVYAKKASLNDLHSDAPKIVLILGGMGLNEKLTRTAITQLPSEVTFAFAPYGNNVQAQVDKARDEGHEIFLQLPLEPVGYPANNPGPRTLLADGDAATTRENLNWLLSRFAGYAGVINYMGGRFLSTPNATKSLLSEIKSRGLNFVEDGSGPMTSTDQVAGPLNMPIRHGTSVIDQNPDPSAITAALDALEQQAQGGEIAIGTGSGLDVTISTVKEWIGEAQTRGVVIIPASAAFVGSRG